MYEIFEEYLKEVQDLTKKYQNMNQVISNDEISGSQLCKVMADWFYMNSQLSYEYRRKKTELYNIQKLYKQWYDEIFLITKRKLHEELNPSNKVTFKLNLTEIEIQIRVDYKDIYYEWQDKLHVIESAVSHYRRLMDSLKKNSDMLNGISNNVRQEMKSLHIGSSFSEKNKNENVRTIKNNS